MTACTPLLFTWLFVSALPPHINLHRILQRHKSEKHRQRGREKMRNVLAIHGINNLTVELLLVQSSLHSLTTVRSPHQIYHEHLGAHKSKISHTHALVIVYICLCVCVCVWWGVGVGAWVCVCVYLIKAHLVRLLRRKRQEAGGLQWRIFHFQRKKRGEGYKENV